MPEGFDWAERIKAFRRAVANEWLVYSDAAAHPADCLFNPGYCQGKAAGFKEVIDLIDTRLLRDDDSNSLFRRGA